MKKKVLISVIAILIAFVIGLGIGFSQKKEIIIENPLEISYFSNVEKTEKFTLTLPQEHSASIFTTIDTHIEGVTSYVFKHIDTGEVLFIVTVSKDEGYKKLSYECEIIKETNDFIYLWSQSVLDNDKVTDKNLREQYNEIAQYCETIKETFNVEVMGSENNVVTVTDVDTTNKE